MTFAAGSGSNFATINQDPNIQTFVAKNATPGKTLEFTVSGTGSMPREDQGAPASGQEAGAPGNGQPGGGIGEPINTPDPLSKYKWWILGGLAIVFAAAAALLLRKPAAAPGVAVAGPGGAVASAPVYAPHIPSSPASKNGALLAALKEELFSLESDKLTGVVSPAEYAETKAALETVLKRALKKSS